MSSFRRIEVPEELEDLIPDFIINTDNDFELLKAFYADKDDKGMRDVCHRVLGTAQSYGFMELDELFSTLQDRLRAGDRAGIASSMETLGNYFEFMHRQFDKKGCA